MNLSMKFKQVSKKEQVEVATYRILPNMEDDLYRIWSYVVKKFGLDQADRYYKALFHEFDVIAKDQFLFPSVDHIKKSYWRGIWCVQYLLRH